MFYIILIVAFMIHVINQRLKRLISSNGFKVYNVEDKRVKKFNWVHLVFNPDDDIFLITDSNLQILEYVGKKLPDTKLHIDFKSLKFGNLGCFERQYSNPYDRIGYDYNIIYKKLPIISFIRMRRKRFVEDKHLSRVIAYFCKFYPNIALTVE